ncbi:MAG: DUF2461 domain-containing protein [Bacteroidaceae bacterium]|nr:DUF2461 domain-containing protein [Bacteroidaceae bacterium]
MKEIISFLRQLKCHNDREWFNAHKSEYLRQQTRFNDFVAELIAGIASFDPSVSGLTPKDCVYRIYRDVRFSDDKSPYKTHLGAFVCPGGKKSGYSGYYFHVSTGGEGYPDNHMLAAGDYCCTPEALRILREDIAYGGGDFEQALHDADSCFRLDREGALKRNPKGFPVGTPYEEYIRLKAFCLCYTPDTDFLLTDNLSQRVAELFRTTKPFLDYINRGIAYSRERE